MAKLEDKWIKVLIEAAQKEPNATKEELQNWFEYCYLNLVEHTGVMAKQLPFTCCYLTALALLKKG